MSPSTDGNFELLHKLATIATMKSFGPAWNQEWFGYRRDMSAQSLRFLVQDFIENLERAQAEMVSLLPESIQEGFKIYCEKRKNTKGETFESRGLIMKKYYFLEKMMTLPVYSWNGERYDLSVLLGPLIETFSSHTKRFEKMKVIKRGTAFMEIQFGFLVFRDFMNFSQPMKLGKSFLSNLNYL